VKATTVRMSDGALERIDGMAKTLSRSRSWIINRAVERFLDYEEWFVKEVEDGLDEAVQGQVATREEVTAKFQEWGVDAD